MKKDGCGDDGYYVCAIVLQVKTINYFTHLKNIQSVYLIGGKGLG